MDADLRKIKKLTAFMRSNGLLHLKSGQIELSLHPSALENQPKQEPEQKQEDKKEYSEEELLFWSAPGINEGIQQ